MRLSDNELIEAVKTRNSHDTAKACAEALGISPPLLAYRLEQAKIRVPEYFDYSEPVDGFSVPDLPDGEMPTDELIEFMTSRYNKRRDAKDARHIIPVKMKDNKPVGLQFFGDPHVDSPQCNWPELRRCVAIIKRTEGLRGVSLGDHVDNWIGRLQREYAKANATADQAWQLADWFIKEINPLLIIRGNHDAWSGHGDPLKYIRGVGNLYEQWKAIIELQFPNGRSAILDIAHDHSGQSMYHPLQGQLKTARFYKSPADLIISGHRHTWGMMNTEMQNRVVWMCRARGFKDHGEYEVVKGFEEQRLGHCITAVFDPEAETETGFINCFAEPTSGAEYLTYLRGSK